MNTISITHEDRQHVIDAVRTAPEMKISEAVNTLVRLGRTDVAARFIVRSVLDRREIITDKNFRLHPRST